jgi:N-acetylneuraminic acid mutarotase
MTWNTADTIPFGPVSWPVSTEVNNEFYVGLGEKFINILSQNLPFTQLWKYNPQQNIWTRLADFPGGYQRYPTMIALNNKIYVFSGAIPVGSSSTNFTREFWQYDPSLNVWSQLQLPPESIIPAGEKCSMAQVNGKLYFFTSQKYTFWGAYYGMDIKRICLEYDPVSITWKKFSIPRQVDLLKVIFQNNNTVYLHSNKVGYTESIINLTYEFINQ